MSINYKQLQNVEVLRQYLLNNYADQLKRNDLGFLNDLYSDEAFDWKASTANNLIGVGTALQKVLKAIGKTSQDVINQVVGPMSSWLMLLLIQGEKDGEFDFSNVGINIDRPAKINFNPAHSIDQLYINPGNAIINIKELSSMANLFLQFLDEDKFNAIGKLCKGVIIFIGFDNPILTEEVFNSKIILSSIVTQITIDSTFLYRIKQKEHSNISYYNEEELDFNNLPKKLKINII